MVYRNQENARYIIELRRQCTSPTSGTERRNTAGVKIFSPASCHSDFCNNLSNPAAIAQAGLRVGTFRNSAVLSTDRRRGSFQARHGKH